MCLWWAVLPWNPISGMHSVAVFCSVLQCVCGGLYGLGFPFLVCLVLQVVSCVAECGSVWQCVAVCLVWAVLPWNPIFGMQSTAASCRMLQCVAVCCSVLQCVAVCCSVLQCCSVRTHDRVSHAAISLSNCVCARLTTHDQI